MALYRLACQYALRVLKGETTCLSGQASVIVTQYAAFVYGMNIRAWVSDDEFY